MDSRTPWIHQRAARPDEASTATARPARQALCRAPPGYGDDPHYTLDLTFRALAPHAQARRPPQRPAIGGRPWGAAAGTAGSALGGRLWGAAAAGKRLRLRRPANGCGVASQASARRRGPADGAPGRGAESPSGLSGGLRAPQALSSQGD